MQHDAMLHVPFQECFFMCSLAGATCKLTAAKLEPIYVNKYGATSALGYNDLPGAPTKCRRFWAICRSKRPKLAAAS